MTELDRVFRALAHEKRLKILNWLRNPTAHFPAQVDGDLVKDGVCVILIANKLEIAQPTATQHLKILLDAGLVTSKRIGQWTFIRRNEGALKKLKSSIEKDI